ncbi:hypothetical protein AYI69_g4311 [Smittium culicis]|uniref:Aminodeoxychorismate lyase n=1 Tax=Smittium culicis TaxID=133412 RepID=A0A1R1XA22_9FUNG|nr:hypothetical protein AYI69_g9810 [Smittium culicis]OMJ25405.1 hypothetical protein AYI69_g4311 [Smittium culicis]
MFPTTKTLLFSLLARKTPSKFMFTRMGIDTLQNNSFHQDTSGLIPLVIITSSWIPSQPPTATIETKSFDSFLLECPNGIYTSARTISYSRILALEKHFARLAKSLDLYVNDDQSRKDRVESKITEILGRENSQAYKSVDFWRDALYPLIKMGLEKNRQKFLNDLHHDHVLDDSSNETPNEAKITISISVDPMIVRLHVCDLKLKDPKDQIIILNKGSRHNPTSKQISWVEERKELEKLLTPRVNEVVLYDPESFHCTEGLSSNFFVVERLPQNEISSANPTSTNLQNNPEKSSISKSDGSQSSSISSTGTPDIEYLTKSFRVATSPPSTVLMGTIMQLVIKVCEDDGIKISYTSPSISDLQTDQWVGAFITSTSRLVLPIETVRLRDRNSELRIGSNMLVQHIKNRVEELAKQDSAKVL